MTLRHPTFEYDTFCDDLKCAICLEAFVSPVEFQPCHHIYCRSCSSSLFSCPTCRLRIRRRREPNRLILSMLDGLQVQCTNCGWRGTRQSMSFHKTCSTQDAFSPGVSVSITTFPSSMASAHAQLALRGLLYLLINSCEEDAAVSVPACERHSVILNHR